MRRIAMCSFLVFAPTLWAQSPPTIIGFLVDSTGVPCLGPQCACWIRRATKLRRS
jgi:hypothetical protein